ncbi:hypothetical protein ZEAMMB73_Zm00001d046730 [Zea mays]|uniref:Uncharacterized protein n=1 Tax=Zea mays TaxID=4577 RepID=A0A1D6P4S1_MAIZE|nr:hypothetical protein ZEAMMB73_Zm00001d046730 [Zea mays]
MHISGILTSNYCRFTLLVALLMLPQR